MHARTRNQIMDALHRHPQAANWGSLLAAQDASLPEFAETLKAMARNQDVVIEKGGMVRALSSPADKGGKQELPDQQCGRCAGKGWVLSAQDERLKAYQRILENRPPPNFAFDQGYITPEDSLLRVDFMRQRGDLHDASILMVGDFDLTSIALAMTGLPKRILVLDIDTRVIRFVRDVAKEHGFPIEAREFDVRRGLDADLVNSFDLFVCDPVETLAGISLYLSRGAESLRGSGAAAYFGLTTIEASRKKWFDIQGVLHGMGFALTDIRRAFSGYPDHDEAPVDPDWSYPIIEELGAAGASARWYTSAFIRLEAVQDPKPLIVGACEMGNEFYVDDEAWATPVAAQH